MDELTLGLIGAGAVVVGGVVVYNAWQGAKVRRKMPRPMPADAAENFARDDHQEQSPFIEPARPTTRREPVVGAETSADTASARVEPTFGVPVGAAPLDTPADIQAETTTPNGYLSDGDDAEAAGALIAALVAALRGASVPTPARTRRRLVNNPRATRRAKPTNRSSRFCRLPRRFRPRRRLSSIAASTASCRFV